MSAQPTEGRAVLALVAVQLLFGVHYSIALEILTEIRPAAWVGLRCGGAALVLALWVVSTGTAWPRRWQSWCRIAALSLLGVVINQVLFIEGLSRSYSIHSVLIMGTIPMQTLFFSVLWGRERVTVRKLASVSIGALGILVLLRIDRWFLESGSHWTLHRDGSIAQGFWDTVLAGDIMMLGNSFSFSLFLVLCQKEARRYSSLTLTASTFAMGSLGVLIYAAPEILRTPYADISASTWGWAGFTILGPTVGCYFLNFYAVKRLPASTVGLFIYLQFVIAALLGVVWRGERFHSGLVVASVLVLGGLGLRFLGRRGSVRPRADGAGYETAP